MRNPINKAGLLATHGLENPLSLLSQFQTDPGASVTLADGTVLRAPGLDLENGGRRLVVLGDTYDASGLVPLIRGSGGGDDDDTDPSWDPLRIDLVVHESTNAYLPTLDDSQTPKLRRVGGPPGSLPTTTNLESVTQLAQSHGHSTPQVAGAFARSVRARELVLNHLSVKYPDPDALGGDVGGRTEASRDKWRRVLREIERQAHRALEGIQETDADLLAVTDIADSAAGGRVVAARDFLEIEIVRRDKLARRRVL